MTQIAINGSDASTLHVFALDLPPETVERFTAMAGTGEWPLKYALGAEALREAFVDVVSIKDLAEMPLTHYLMQAYDIAGADLQKDKARLDALTGYVLVLPPQAFDNHTQTLTISAPLRHIGAYGSEPAKPRGAAVRSDAARGQGKTPQDAPPMRGLSRGVMLLLIGMAVLIVLTLGLIL